MNIILKRIKNIMESQNLTESAFCKKIGLSQSTINSLYQRDSYPRADQLALIVSIFEINANWLLTGKGNMYLNTSDKDIKFSYKNNIYTSLIEGGNEICEKLCKLKTENKIKLLGYADALLDLEESLRDNK